MARRTLGLGSDVQPTVTGGLTFFGAPLNDYMAHAACAMVRKIRAGTKTGLLYAQGGFVTKHHALVIARAPPSSLSQDVSVQTEADRHRAAAPAFVSEASGNGMVESFTALHDRDGGIEHGVVMLRTEHNGRTLARVPAQDKATLARLMSMDKTPVGVLGAVTMAADGVPEWRVA
jgi:acetyl-CoA C-acetyltransferase